MTIRILDIVVNGQGYSFHSADGTIAEVSLFTHFPLKFTFATESARVSAENTLTSWSCYVVASVASTS
jgi:hypothetical protein